MNRLLHGHILEVKRVLEGSGIEANLYLAGSLARGEPSVRSSGAGLGLNSDLDFVMAIRSESEEMRELEPRLNRMFPDFNDTLYFIKDYQIPRAGSSSGHDLALAIRTPIYQTFHVSPPALRPLTEYDYFEVIVYQMAAVLFQGSGQAAASDYSPEVPSYWRRDAEYCRLKLILESLRGVSESGRPSSGNTYKDLYHRRGSRSLKGIIEAEQVADLIRARELWRRKPLPLSQTIQAILPKILSRFSSSASSEPRAVISALRGKFYQCAHLLHCFPLATVIFYYAGRAAVREKSSLLGSALECLEEIPVDHLGEELEGGRHSLKALHRGGHDPDAVQERLSEFMRSLRRSYIRMLKSHKDEGRRVSPLEWDKPPALRPNLVEEERL